MSKSGWREQVQAYIRAEASPVDKYGHQPRLYALASQLGAGLSYDDDVLFAACWLHDLGVFLGHRPLNPEQLKGWDHLPYTIERSRQLLADWGFPEEKLESVAEAIRTHQAWDEPQEMAAVLLHDADILEQLGAIGIMRALAKVGRDTRFDRFTQVVQILQKAVNELPSRLRLNQSRNLAASRIEILRAFLLAAEAEAGNLLD
ncbi:HD domain-containing protein [Telmatobacter bradus]|uniref:HD domain-containing protein n=1 Tax=Telmatobacter bradus TaxID=474953 RepID=UPI003B42C892